MNALRFTILSCSLREDSRSRRLAGAAVAMMRAAGDDVALVDLRDSALPPFDDDAVFADPAYPPLHHAIAQADAVFIAAPVYNWGLGGAVRNLTEVTGATSAAGLGPAWFDKLVTFGCTGGLPHSYMAYGATAMSLMLDFKCVVNPYLTYAAERDWQGDGTLGEPLAARLAKTVAVQRELAGALRGRRYRSAWEV